MSKELIERLRNAAIFATSECAWLMTEAADALEAKAAPVGEREAFEAEIIECNNQEADFSRKPDGDYQNFYLQCAWNGFQAGAAYQRAQQPQSAEAVAWIPATIYPPFGELVLTNIGPAYMTEKQPGVWFKRLDALGIGARLGAGAVNQWRKIATPQPSAGVVMPERKQLPDLMLAEFHESRGWNACLDEFARLNKGELE